MKIPWECDPHTVAKHRVLERYLQAWWPIMLTKMPRATYIEGFAGPGVYEGGEPGSPIVALRTLRAATAPDKPVDLIFIDREQKCLDRLRTEIDTHAGALRPLTNPPRLVHGDAARELLTHLHPSAWSGGVFAFLDSWGNVAVPLDVVRRFARRGSEVFVTLGRRFWQQFGTSLGPEWDAMFGSADWRQVREVQGAPAQARFLKERYVAALHSVGFTYTLDFELVDDRGEYLYLVHATTNLLGVEKMKDAIWDVDPVRGVGFRDPRRVAEGQEALELEWRPDIAPLKRLIVEWLRDRPMTLEEVRHRAFLDTVYRKPHATTAVRELLQDGLLHRSPAGGQLNGSVLLTRP